MADHRACRHPFAHFLGKVFFGDGIECCRVGYRLRDLFELALLAGIDAGYQQGPCFVALLAGFGQSDFRISAQSQRFLFATVAIGIAPKPRTNRHYPQLQPFTVRNFLNFIGWLQGSNRNVGERHVGILLVSGCWYFQRYQQRYQQIRWLQAHENGRQKTPSDT